MIYFIICIKYISGLSKILVLEIFSRIASYCYVLLFISTCLNYNIGLLFSSLNKNEVFLIHLKLNC